MFCEQGEHLLVAKRDLPQFLHSYTSVSLICPWETRPVSVDGLFRMMGGGGVQEELLASVEICGPGSALLVPNQLETVRSSPSSQSLGQGSVTAGG